MKLAFCLFNYFPYGGLQRDFARIAESCVARGHEVHVYTMMWEGEKLPGIHIHLLPVKAWQNHVRLREYTKALNQHLCKEKYDVVVGFNKMPNLDIYYAADVCYQARAREKHGFLYRLLPRYRQLVSFERAVFAKGGKTSILTISPMQQAEYQRYYQTEANRFHLLPPGITKDRIPAANAAEIRQALRHELGLKGDSQCLLMIGSGFKTKGLNRAIQGLAGLPVEQRIKTHLFVAGQDKKNLFENQAKNMGVGDQVHFLGGRKDVPALLLAADVLVHPAYHENTGTVLLEAMVAGLPVLTLDVCGYAPYIEKANAGVVLSSPYQQTSFDKALYNMLTSGRLAEWRQNAISFSQKADIYSMPEKAVSQIEQLRRKD